MVLHGHIEQVERGIGLFPGCLVISNNLAEISLVRNIVPYQVKIIIFLIIFLEMAIIKA